MIRTTAKYHRSISRVTEVSSLSEGPLTFELCFNGVNRQHFTQEGFSAKPQCKVFIVVTAGHYDRQGTSLVQGLCGTGTVWRTQENPAKPGDPRA